MNIHGCILIILYNMKIGSLVELVDDNWGDLIFMIEAGIIFPVKNKIYIIRGFDTDYDALYVEEIINRPLPFADGYAEPSFLNSRFRELLPPIQINIEKSITVKS